MLVGSAALRHLSDVLASKPELAPDRMGVMLVQASQAYYCPSVLAVSRFLAHCDQRQQHEDLLKHVVRFLDDLPGTASDPFHSEAAASNFFLELVGYLEAIARDWPVASHVFTTSLVTMLEAESHSPLSRAFLCALSTNCFSLHESVLGGVRRSLLEHWLQDKSEDVLSAEVDALQRQRIGLRLFLHTLAKASEEQVQPFWSASARQLRALLPLLKLRKRDLPGTEGPVTLKICLVFEASQAAALVQTKVILMLAKCSEGTLWETLSLFMDAADGCISSPWRRLKACESLFDSLLSGISQVVSARKNQTILHRLRLLVLRTCAYADTWGTNQGPFFQSVVKASCSIIQAGWKADRPAAESFLLSLAAHIRQLSEQVALLLLAESGTTLSLSRLTLLADQEEKEKQAMAVMQLNVIPLLADITINVNRVEAVDVIMPMFLESLEEGEASVPSLLRLRFLDAVARMACLGFEKSYREAVALLMKSYTDKLSTVGSTQSRTLAPEATTERVETLPAAFHIIAARLEGKKLRADYRLRLLTLCSEVGLAAEAKSGRSGADLLGPLLPAVAEICSDFRPSHAIEPSLLKLFRNLWFYIVLFGLAPPIQKLHSSSRSLAASVSSLGSMSAMALQAVAGPYLWNAQWSTAVQRITEATPPLVASSMKWLEDELELNALHNPGSRRGSNNEKAAVAQRAALAAALGGRVEASSMSAISGVKATYLLAVSFLELLRFSSNGGIFRNSQGTVLSSLSCTLVYLETPQLTPDVRQCVYAIVHRAFDAAMNWLGNTDKRAEERETVLVAHATYLIQHLIHRNESIRELADILLKQLRNRFPQALWNARCLDSLLCLVESTSVPTDHSVLVRQRVREWITCSLLLAPATTQGLLQEHLLKTWQQDGGSSELLSLFSELRVDVSKVDGSNGQTAFIPAVTAAAAAAAVGHAQNGHIKVLSGVTSVNWKSTAMQRYQEAKTTTYAPEEACETTFADFVQSLQQFVALAERGEQFDAADYRKACHQATALLLSDVSLYRMASTENFIQLLRLLCWCPAYIFTPAAMETGIFVWTWLLSTAPQLGCLILSELVDAWLWTIDTRRGLFAAGIESSGPAARLRPHLTPGEPGPAVDPIEGILAHRLWLGFLLERFEVVKYNSKEELLLLGRLLQGSVHSLFTRHPVATGTIFTLMLLGLKFCSWGGQASLSAGILEDRIYRTCLAWFSVEPGWYQSKLIDAQTEVQAVVAFVQQLASSQHEHAAQESTLVEKAKVKQLLLLLCQHEADRLETWAFPLRDFVSRLRVHADRWPDFARLAWSIDPRLALSLPARFPFAPQLKSEISTLVQEHLVELRRFPEALPYFVTPKAVDDNSAVLQQLPHWAPCSITRALEFLTPPYKGHCRVMAYVLRVLESYPPERVLFFMPQLVQALRYDEGGLVEGYLMVAAKRSNLFAHILIWQLQGEEIDETAKESPVSKGSTLPEIVRRVKKRIIDSFTPEAFDLFLREFRLFDRVTSISGLLYPLPRDERRAAIRRELEKIQVEGDDLYLPTAPTKLVRGFKLDSGIPLQSAAKVPIMITFEVVDKEGDEKEIQHQACIFKVGDDCRQDVLALQVIALLRDIFQAVGLDLYLFPYGVLPTGYGRGIIEVVPNTRSRNQMGEMSDGGLYEVFQQEYGPVGSPRFEAARDNFITSSAGYAVASLLLQPKDRHNGNLLFDSEGRLVHIDFGFILETSPGGNLRFESAQFKLSHEMTQLIDPSGAMKSETWNRFVSLCVKGYLAARQHMDGIVNTVLLMVDSGLPCFSRGDPIGNLRRRFHPEMCEREAANFMIRTCGDAYNKWSTAGYDLIQYLQQGIEK